MIQKIGLYLDCDKIVDLFQAISTDLIILINNQNSFAKIGY